MDPFIGEIRAVGFSVAPQGWALRDGSLMQVSQYTALFSVLGTTYGGNGTTAFALPDLRSRVILGVGQGSDLSPNWRGQTGGLEAVGLTAAQLPAHSHPFVATILTAAVAEAPAPDGGLPAPGKAVQFAKGAPNAAFGAQALGGTTSASGGNQTHENRQPLIALNYAIAVQGTYPKPTPAPQ